MTNNSSDFQANPAWRNSQQICALADGERHLGHILQIGGRWYAFDATHFNETGDGFRRLGSFASLASAREAVELSSGKASSGKALRAFAGAA
jgi:hypothetical protein